MPLDRETYPGLYNALATPDTALELDDVADDVAAEQETLTSGSPEVPANSSAGAGITDGLSSLQETLKHVSKGISDSTESEYKRLISNCDTFLKERGLLQDGESLFSRPPRREAAYLIVVWIMDVCDSVKLDGTNKPSTDERGSYGHAQKMRAAMTYAFGHLQGLGNLPWHESELHSGQMLGNPSVSVEVSSYMCSLRRRKVQAGEVAVSARAITSRILERMYHFNHRPENWAILDYQPGGRGDGSSESSRWAGGRMRRCLHAAYTIAFLCMLRSDEVLKIQLHDLHFFSNGLILTLPFRKTHQNGDIKPFWLWIMPTEGHLCAVQAIAEWITASRITTGYLFRKFASGDRITEANQPLTSERFLELFRNNLLDIGVDPSSYGTRSFRRGGCQYLHIERRWPLRRICEWGGWSLEFTNLTIVKYLISHNDDATELREHFFNPDRSPSVKCPHCGRSCPCA